MTGNNSLSNNKVYPVVSKFTYSMAFIAMVGIIGFSEFPNESEKIVHLTVEGFKKSIEYTIEPLNSTNMSIVELRIPEIDNYQITVKDHILAELNIISNANFSNSKHLFISDTINSVTKIEINQCIENKRVFRGNYMQTTNYCVLEGGGVAIIKDWDNTKDLLISSQGRILGCKSKSNNINYSCSDDKQDALVFNFPSITVDNVAFNNNKQRPTFEYYAFTPSLLSLSGDGYQEAVISEFPKSSGNQPINDKQIVLGKTEFTNDELAIMYQKEINKL